MKTFSLCLIISCGLLYACQKDENRTIDSSYQPDVNPSKFSNPTNFTNPYYPLEVGKTYHYEGQTSEGFEVVEEHRSDETRVIMGITCVVSKFQAWVDTKLVEETDDWLAQDNDGNLWYFGEAVNNYKSDGTLENHDGSWEAGVDGAQQGIVMPANPTIGLSYREEYYFNVAEDEAEITGLNLNVSVPYGQFTNCIETRNWTDLEPDQDEHKYYAPGVGLLKEIETDNSEILLISIQ